MSHRQNVTVDCSQCGAQTDFEYLICTTCYEDIKNQLEDREEELMDKDVEIKKLVDELEEIDDRLKYYKDLVESCTTCGAKHTANNL